MLYNNSLIYTGIGSRETPTDILNIFTKLGAALANRHYVMLEKALINLKQFTANKTIAIPYKMGCNNAGGDWNIVYAIINKIFADSSTNVQIWSLF